MASQIQSKTHMLDHDRPNSVSQKYDKSKFNIKEKPKVRQKSREWHNHKS